MNRSFKVCFNFQQTLKFEDRGIAYSEDAQMAPLRL